MVGCDRSSRFSDGSYGVWYCSDRVEVALAETAHHSQKFMRATSQPAADADFRLLACEVSEQIELAPTECLLSEDWRPGQLFGRQVRALGLDGVLYQSVRYPTGQAAAVFWPGCLRLPIVQTEHFRYRWDGNRMTHYLLHTSTEWALWPIPDVA